MVSSLSNPPVLAKPFAENGDKTSNIPTSATGTQAASLDEGFPPVTSTPINEGGIPPQREDFNGLGYLTTSQFFYLQMGGRFTFNSAVSNAIGGYPERAVLQYTDPDTGQSYEVTSLIPNNTYNFVTTPSYIDGVKWRKSFSEDLTNYMKLTGTNTNSATNTFSGSNNFSGTTTAVTQATSDNSTKVATTAFVKNQSYATYSFANSCPYPKVSSRVNISTSTSSYIAPSNGVMYFDQKEGNVVTTINIDGVTMVSMRGHSGSSHGQPSPCATVIVGKNQEVTWSANTCSAIRFVPFGQ